VPPSGLAVGAGRLSIARIQKITGLAAILTRELPQPDVNRQKPPHVP
jgi:hypothetical protein